MTPLVFLDTETTSLGPTRKVWEVGMIRRDEFGQRETSFMIKVSLDAADPVSLAVGRFYERHPQGIALSRASRRSNQPAPTQPTVNGYDAASRVAEWTHGAHIVGAVPNFDSEVLERFLRGHGLIPAWHYHLIDVKALAVGFLNGRRHRQNQIVDLYPLENNGDPAPGLVRWDTQAVDQPPWSSDGLSLECGVEPATEQERHTAMGDARWAMRLYDAITGAAS
jgi:hypothetical protein